MAQAVEAGFAVLKGISNVISEIAQENAENERKKAEIKRIYVENQARMENQNEKARERTERIARAEAIQRGVDESLGVYQKAGWHFSNTEELRQLQHASYQKANELRDKLVNTGLYAREELARLDYPHLLQKQRELPARIARVRANLNI